MKCCVCKGEIQEHSHNGKVYWTEGHNAQPLGDGRCCDSCNGYVISFRMFGLISPSATKEEIQECKLEYIATAKNASEYKGEEE